MLCYVDGIGPAQASRYLGMRFRPQVPIPTQEAELTARINRT
jgi:hypothetical protein